MTEYTPTTEEIREFIEAADRVIAGRVAGSAAEAFDRWLSAHDAKRAQAETSRELDEMREVLAGADHTAAKYWRRMREAELEAASLRDALEQIWSVIQRDVRDLANIDPAEIGGIVARALDPAAAEQGASRSPHCERCGHLPSEHLVSSSRRPDPCRRDGCTCPGFAVVTEQGANR